MSGCSRNTNVNYYGSGMDALVSGCSPNTHVSYYGSGKDALVSGCSRSMNVIMVGHGCSSDRMLAKHESFGHGWQKGHARRYAARPQNTANMGIKWSLAAWQVHKTPRLSAKLSSYNPLKTARLHQAGGKNQ